MNVGEFEKVHGALLVRHDLRCGVRGAEFHWRIFGCFAAARTEHECGDAYSKRGDFHCHLHCGRLRLIETHGTCASNVRNVKLVPGSGGRYSDRAGPWSVDGNMRASATR